MIVENELDSVAWLAAQIRAHPHRVRVGKGFNRFQTTGCLLRVSYRVNADQGQGFPGIRKHSVVFDA